MKIHNYLSAMVLMTTIISCKVEEKKTAVTESGPRDILKKVCEANNLFALEDKSELLFQFNVQTKDKSVTRNWKWDIKGNKCYLNGVLQEDRSKFTNDIYWLTFPLKAYHDKAGTSLEYQTGVEAPLSKSKCNQLSVTYTGGKGYTPDDKYLLYLNNKYEIIEWSYMKGGATPPTRTTKWQDYRAFEGISFSLLREGENEFKVWFDSINVR